MRTKVALIAHNSKKPAIIALCGEFKEVLAQEELVSTKATGGLLSDLLGLEVVQVNSGEKGGDLQVGAMVASDEIKAVIFLRDPLTAHPHEPDINAVLKVCDVHNVVLATNVVTARLVLAHLKELQEQAFEEKTNGEATLQR
jgi:methylglyoxal synthase